jgi:hypothetical protein|tara:strand:- start:1285 stop:1761 length:477 start_codon:yes stop_codon:yes gene_type:complete
MSLHILNNKFILYFHDPLSYNWTLQSYINIADVGSIEDYWYINSLLREHLHLGMFFLMRDKISPLWNETNNNYSFSMKVLKNESLWYWNHMNSLVLSENFLNTKYKDKLKTINGLSISPKKNFCIIKIWSTEIINDDIRKVYKIPDKYTGDIVVKKYN